MYIFIVSRLFLLRMRNVSNKRCRENQKTHFVFGNFFFRKWCRLWKNVEKYCREGQAKDEYMAHAQCMMETKGYKCTHSGCGTLIAFRSKNGCTNAPQYYVICALPVLFLFVSALCFLHCVFSLKHKTHCDNRRVKS